MKQYYKVGKKKFDSRFIYWSNPISVPPYTPYVGRRTRMWWKSFVFLGNFAEKLNYSLDRKRVTRQYWTFHWWIRKHLLYT